MVILSVLIFLPYNVLFVLGIAIVCFHNLLDGITLNGNDWPSFGWAVIHQQHVFDINGHLKIALFYPVLSWLGLMICGYCLGKLFLPGVDSGFRKKVLRYTGLFLIVLFIIIRWTDLYGDMNKWANQRSALYTFFDFIDVTKYPPSILYMLMTIGPALILLSLFEKTNNMVSREIIVFGKVPFFYYVLHVFLIHFFAWIAFFITGHSWQQLDFTHFRNGSLPYGSGYRLWVVYMVWALIIIILYFPCRWYSQYKATHSQWWLSYI